MVWKKLTFATEEERRIKEKALLLRRFYYLDKLYTIGKDLNISYFDQYKNWWEIDYSKGDEAALEIAKIISDEDLLRLTKETPPKYGLNLGGFQGNYYSCSEAGEVRLESSWDAVRGNIQKALDKWKDKAYGVLKGIISKGGRASYFELIDAIEQALGYEFIPSYLLPRFASPKLIFKTGSNKYPDWTMPPEIIPVVKQELLEYEAKRLKVMLPKKALRRDIGRRLVQAEHTQYDAVDKITQLRSNVNLIFNERYGIKLFKQNERAMIDITKPCANEEDFNNRILSLTTLIAEIETDEIKKHFETERVPIGSINMLEALLSKLGFSFDPSLIKNLRMIQNLRSAKFPIHSGSPKFIKALKYFDYSFPPNDWQAVWETLLQKYLESLKDLEQCLINSGKQQNNASEESNG